MLREFDAFSLKSVQVWSWCIATMKGHIRPSEVVGDDENNVWLRLGSNKRR